MITRLHTETNPICFVLFCLYNLLTKVKKSGFKNSVSETTAELFLKQEVKALCFVSVKSPFYWSCYGWPVLRPRVTKVKHCHTSSVWPSFTSLLSTLNLDHIRKLRSLFQRFLLSSNLLCLQHTLPDSLPSCS